MGKKSAKSTVGLKTLMCRAEIMVVVLLVQGLGATNKRNGLDILRESRMNHKERSHLIKQVIDAAKSHAKCKNLHHKKAHQHAFGWVCPAEAELEAAIYRVELMLQKGERDELR